MQSLYIPKLIWLWNGSEGSDWRMNAPAHNRSSIIHCLGAVYLTIHNFLHRAQQQRFFFLFLIFWLFCARMEKGYVKSVYATISTNGSLRNFVHNWDPLLKLRSIATWGAVNITQPNHRKAQLFRSTISKTLCGKQMNRVGEVLVENN